MAPRNNGPDWERFGLISTSEAVWEAWNALPADTASPVKTIAAQLHLTTGEVAAIVYPPATFGVWDDAHEADVT